MSWDPDQLLRIDYQYTTNVSCQLELSLQRTHVRITTWIICTLVRIKGMHALRRSQQHDSVLKILALAKLLHRSSQNIHNRRSVGASMPISQSTESIPSIVEKSAGANRSLHTNSPTASDVGCVAWHGTMVVRLTTRGGHQQR